jgi:hypothetical protein
MMASAPKLRKNLYSTLITPKAGELFHAEFQGSAAQVVVALSLHCRTLLTCLGSALRSALI